jgi:hypothetical protein
MASKVFEHGKPSVYPDNSTLCDAFRAAMPGGRADRAYAPLKAWFERVALEANLCLSIHHLSELARWSDQDTADAMAAWYEALPIVWAKSTQTIEAEEGEHWTKVAAGVTSPGVNPFSATLLGAFHALTPEMTARLLGSNDQARVLLGASRQMGHDREERFMGDTAQTFRDDLAWADENGLTTQQRQELEAQNERRALRELAREADTRLTARRDIAYARKPCTGGQVQDLLVELFGRDPTAMPYFRVQRRLWPGFRSRAGRRAGPSNNERAALAGALEDNLHASVGAAYCDVFTCDGEVAEWLGDLRARLGRRPQMTARAHVGGANGFVRDLMATC